MAVGGGIYGYACLSWEIQCEGMAVRPTMLIQGILGPLGRIGVRGSGRDVCSEPVELRSTRRVTHGRGDGLRVDEGPRRAPVRHFSRPILDKPRAMYVGLGKTVQGIVVYGPRLLCSCYIVIYGLGSLRPWRTYESRSKGASRVASIILENRFLNGTVERLHISQDLRGRLLSDF